MPDDLRLSRRSVLAMALAGMMAGKQGAAGQTSPTWPEWACAPIGWTGQVPGVGFRGTNSGS